RSTGPLRASVRRSPRPCCQRLGPPLSLGPPRSCVVPTPSCRYQLPQLTPSLSTCQDDNLVVVFRRSATASSCARKANLERRFRDPLPPPQPPPSAPPTPLP